MWRPAAPTKNRRRAATARFARDLARFFFLSLALWLAACEEEPKPAEAPVARIETPPAKAELGLVATPFAALPGWSEDRLAEALPALLRSCELFAKRDPQTKLGPNALGGTIADWLEPCSVMTELDPQDDEGVQIVFEAWFEPMKVTDGSPDSGDKGTFTGYYEAELAGEWAQKGPAATPVYGLPDDLVRADLGHFASDLAGRRIIGKLEGNRLVPYPSRAEIESGMLAGRGLELFWAKDAVDAFFLHVQGSGRVVFPDGSSRRFGFAGSNGLPFYAIGRALIDEGLVPRGSASMQSIRDWLRANPQEGRQIMQRNARFIFFREITGPGPIGSQGVPLTAGRSLAVDPAFIPLGVPVFLDTTWPGSDRPLRRLMVAQDTGSAIIGPVRGDFYWGSGDAALEFAGGMNQRGTYYLLLPKPVAARHKSTS